MSRGWMKKAVSALCLCGLLVALSPGCGGGGETAGGPAPAKKEKTAKKKKGKRKKTKAAAAMDEIDRILSGVGSKPWRYDPTNKWDPFLVPPPPIKGETPGERYDVEQMSLLGVIRGSGMDAAYIRMPDGTDRIVRVGDVLGKHGGEVKEIGKDYIIVEERYIDPTRPTETFIIEKELKLAEIKRKRR